MAALRRRDRALADAALRDSRALEGRLTELRTAAAEGVAVVRQSPLLRGHAPMARAGSDLVVPLDRCVRNLRVLARRASVAVARGEVVPERYVDLVVALADAADDLARVLDEHATPSAARGVLERVAGLSARVDPAAGLSAEMIRGQVRSMVVDLLVVAGLDDDEALQLVPRVPPPLRPLAMLGPVTSRPPEPGPDAVAPRTPAVTVVVAIVLVAANLRTLMASLPPLAETVRGDLGLSSAWMGVLTTLPVLCMGLLGPSPTRWPAGWARRWPSGSVSRPSSSASCCAGLGDGATWSLYGGTFVAGAGIALAGTLLPGIVKAVFPARRAGLGTGLTMVSMMGAAAVASAVAVPLAAALGGWSRSLLVWAAGRGPRARRVGARRAGGAPAHPARRRTRRRHPRPALGQRDGLAPRRPTSPASRGSSTRRSPGSPRPTSPTVERP